MVAEKQLAVSYQKDSLRIFSNELIFFGLLFIACAIILSIRYQSFNFFPFFIGIMPIIIGLLLAKYANSNQFKPIGNANGETTSFLSKYYPRFWILGLLGKSPKNVNKVSKLWWIISIIIGVLIIIAFLYFEIRRL